MNLQNIIIKYKNIYIYEKTRNIILCDYGIEIENESIILCKYEILVKYFSIFNKNNLYNNIFCLSDDLDYDVFCDLLQILKEGDLTLLKKIIMNYDHIKLSELIYICNFLKSTNIIYDYIYDIFIDNIKDLYNILKNVEMENILYEKVLENFIIRMKAKMETLIINDKNPSNKEKDIDENVYFLIKLMIDWMSYINLLSKNKIRTLLNNLIIYLKTHNYIINNKKFSDIIINDCLYYDDSICDILPLNCLYIK